MIDKVMVCFLPSENGIGNRMSIRSSYHAKLVVISKKKSSGLTKFEQFLQLILD